MGSASYLFGFPGLKGLCALDCLMILNSLWCGEGSEASAALEIKDCWLRLVHEMLFLVEYLLLGYAFGASWICSVDVADGAIPCNVRICLLSSVLAS